ncbi:hypothetical protein G6F56_014397 [Rhizopus delemar]|nr:hypothetical protein G6F21_014456 [Rhizopus arrhizus]KAG1434203.1 hypothetical protein G6F56_014397 [Rhizopus delemar]
MGGVTRQPPDRGAGTGAGVPFAASAQGTRAHAAERAGPSGCSGMALAAAVIRRSISRVDAFNRRCCVLPPYRESPGAAPACVDSAAGAGTPRRR